MLTNEVSVKDLCPIDVWVEPSVKIVRQLTMWDGIKKHYVFVPAKRFGRVIVSTKLETGGKKLMQGYTLHRPCGLELSWHTDRTVVFHELSIGDMYHFQKYAQNGHWKTIGIDESGGDAIPL